MDSFYDEMEPRASRPVIPVFQDQRGVMNLQVSEPSLMNTHSIENDGPVMNWMLNGIKPIPPREQPKQDFQTVRLQQTSRVLKDLQNFESRLSRPNPTHQSSDLELKKLIENQNAQLQLLHKQVEKLLEYQELLHSAKAEKSTVNEATQTSLLSKEPTNFKKQETNLLHVNNQTTMSDRSELTLGFQDLRLETIVEQPPSPPCSVLVNMQDYPESMSEQYCIIKNDNSHDIMEQVQKLLAEANGPSIDEPNLPKANNNHHTFKGISATHELETSMKKITIKQVHDVGISFNATSLNRLLVLNSNKSASWDVSQRETDKSIEMQQLARKYLGRLEWAEEKSVCLRNSVEMSMSSQQYLAKYGLLPSQTKSNWK